MLRRPPILVRILLPIVALAIIAPCERATAQSDQQSLRTILQLIPPGAHAAVIVPSLKRASDDLTRMMEGMDRANILLGARPIDQAKSITGLTAGIDDLGSAAMVVLDANPIANARRPHVLWIVPITDAQEFLTTNFAEAKDAGPNAHRLGDGTIVHIRTLDSHALISANAEIVRTYEPAGGAESALAGALGERATLLTSGETLVIVRQPAIGAIKQTLLQHAADFNLRLPGIALLAQELADDAETLVLAIDCDPLALILRGFVRFRESADFGKLAAPPLPRSPDSTQRDPGLARLPNKPYALAVSVDLAALGSEGMLRGVAQAMDEPAESVPQWLAHTRSLQFAVAHSPAGAAGGLLNEAMLVLASDDAPAVRESIKRDVLAAAEHPTIQREAVWHEDQSLPNVDGGLTADVWEVRTRNVPPELSEIAVIEHALFGTASMRGYVRQEADGVLMTFSQRPAVMESLTESVRQAVSPQAPANIGFGGSAVIRTMRQWLPAQRDVEWYVHAGALRAMLAEQAAAVPGGTAAFAVLPEFGTNLPPVGGAIDVSPQRAECALVVPAGVLAPLFDALLRRAPQLRPAPEPQ